MKAIGTILLGVVIAATLGASAADEGVEIGFQGRLTDANGNALNGSAYRLTFRIYAQETGGSPVWTETHDPVQILDGIYSVVLGRRQTLTLSGGTGYWISIEVNGNGEMSPRLRLARGHLEGPTGQKGDQGDRGDRGEKGERGDQGDQGPVGQKGDQGPKGDRGDQGLQGDRGDQGLKGDTGAKGDKGDTGEKGLKGDRGDQGIKGDTGAKGDKGDQGTKGDTGPQGPQGPSGTISLPYYKSTSNSSTLFDVRNTGSGRAITAIANNSYGLYAISSSSNSSHCGVYAYADSTYGLKAQSDLGIWSNASGSGSDAIFGWNESSGTGSWGVRGKSKYGYGVYGESANYYGGKFYTASSSYYGAYIQGSSSTGNGLFVSGKIVKTGTVSFVERHPKDRDKAIVYICLEGGEAGTYCRGSGTLVNGVARVELPEHFRMVTGTPGITVQVTPTGPCAGLFVAEKSRDSIVVRELAGGSTSGVTFDWIVHGHRKGYEDYDPITSEPAVINALNDGDNPSAKERRIRSEK